MLVLSRRGDQAIAFPNVGVTVRVLRVRGNVVKLGIDAPRDIEVLREEVLDGELLTPRDDARERRHAMKNRLHAAKLALHLLKKQVEFGAVADFENTFDRVVTELESLDDELAPTPAPTGLVGKSRKAILAEKRRALLVEDDANQSELLAGYLRMSGFEVRTAGDGYDALDELRDGTRPDVVLLDMRMPRCDGPETIDRIRRDPRFEGLRVYAISGTAPGDLGVPEGPSGVDRWFPKPLDPETLVRTLKNEFTAVTGA